mmetsp:Transcript_27672/g.42909  ORF Transcript_27672/g.42909 Transcript_27672/m.42909 type:complete len:318 (-) Transcript_27672:424-1377(-)
MKLTIAGSILAYASAFTIPGTPTRSFASTRLYGLYEGDTLDAALERELNYKPGQAKGALAQRFGNLAGRQVRTVGEAFSDFTKILGCSINSLYKNMVTDIVGSTHLIVVDARFKRDAIWSLGIVSALEILLKNYPEKDIAARIVSSLMECLGLNEAEVQAEARAMLEYVEGKTIDDITKELETGEGDSPIAKIAAAAKADEFWMYSKFFGLGLVKIGEIVGMESNMDDGSAQMEKWMTALGKPTFTCMADSDQWFRSKAKLDMMETLMKEIEIREKKRMADRLEQKAEMAIKKAEEEARMQADLEQKEKERSESVSN